MQIAGTGHRPDKLGGYGKAAERSLMSIAHNHLIPISRNIEMLYTGLALGWDTVLAFVCWEHGIPYTACIPFKGQENRWSLEAKDRYHHLVYCASKVVYVSEPPYSAAKMMIRNKYMVDQLIKPEDYVLAIHDGSEGGTNNCVRYAASTHKKVVNVYDLWLKLNPIS